MAASSRAKLLTATSRERAPEGEEEKKGREEAQEDRHCGAEEKGKHEGRQRECNGGRGKGKE